MKNACNSIVNKRRPPPAAKPAEEKSSEKSAERKDEEKADENMPDARQESDAGNTETPKQNKEGDMETELD